MRPRTIGVAALLAAALAGCVEVRATGEAPTASVIRATGTGRLSVRPDTALVRLGAESRGANLADATADVSRRMADVLQRVRASVSKRLTS